MVRFSRIACVLILIVIALVTLSPIEWRPQTGHVSLERGAAYLLFGVALGTGFPRRLPYCWGVVVTVAVVLEALQLIDPGRHARVQDMLVKAAGGVIGTLIPWALTRMHRYVKAG